MKVGDLVKWNGKLAVITEVYESKCWRTNKMGKKVNWGQVEAEPFARILSGSVLVGVPQCDLEAIENE